MNNEREIKKLPAYYSISVIVPAYNEVENIEPLAREFDEFLSAQSFRAEVIVVDDGSTDGTAEKVIELSQRFRFLKLVRHKINLGKTAAIETGFSASSGKRIAIFDADLQYDPWDIKRLMDKLDRGYGVVSGIKKGKYQKPIISKLYNWLTRQLFDVDIRDMNSLKVIRRDVMADLFLRKDWHRFMVVLAAEKGHKTAEIPVTLRPRRFGKAKYGGFGRVFVGLTDLFAVWLSEKVFKKPMLVFGTTGVIFLGLAIILASFILIMRLGFHWGYPPLQTFLIILISLGGFSLTLGFIAEAIANLRDRIEFLMGKISKPDLPVIESAENFEIEHNKKSHYQRRESWDRRKSREHERKNEDRKSHARDRRTTEQRPEHRQKKERQERPLRKQRKPEGNELPIPIGMVPEKETEKQPIKIEPEAHSEKQVGESVYDGLEIIPPSSEPSWGRKGRRTKITASKADEPDAFKNIEELAHAIDDEASVSFAPKKEIPEDNEKPAQGNAEHLG